MRVTKVLLALCCIVLLFGCAERRIIITSEPSGAAVTMDGQEKGITPVSVPFSFYGNREVVLEKDGYQSLKSIIPVNPPVFQVFPLDLLMLFVPYPFVDTHSFYFIMEKQGKTDIKKCMERMDRLKEYLEEKLRNEGSNQSVKK